MSSWWLIVGIVAGLLLLALIIMLATRSKESKSNYLKRSESFENCLLYTSDAADE